MTDVKLSAWSSFVSLVKNFLGNHKALNYVELLENEKLYQCLQNTKKWEQT